VEFDPTFVTPSERGESRDLHLQAFVVAARDQERRDYTDDAD